MLDAVKNSATTTLRERCRAMSMPVWRADGAGKLTGPPDEPAPLGLWLRSGAITRLVSETTARWAVEERPDPTELFPGAWLIPIALMHRRERRGFLAVMALSPAGLQDEWFLAGCVSAQLDARAIRTAMTPMARHSEGSVRAMAQSLAWMLEDCERRRQDDATIKGFTRQLTDGFETIDLLYGLSRSMSDLARPGEFARLVCDRLKQSMPFAWIGAWFGADAKIGAMVGEQFMIRGRHAIDEQTILRVLEARPMAGDLKARIVSDLAGTPLPGDCQVVIQPIARKDRLMGALLCGEKGGDDPQVSSYDIHLVEAAAGYVGAFLENASLYADQQAMFLGTLRATTASIDAKDRYTRGHSERVAYLSRKLALRLGLGEAAGERLHICGLVHDVGKIGVPEAVLGKRGKLDDAEFEAIKRHPQIGYDILKDIPLLEDILPGVLHHHERFDGRGYPRGLKGLEIPLFARIVAHADTFDAMSSNRSYRAAMPREKVLAEMMRVAGAQLDPEMTPHFVALDFSEYDAMVTRHAEHESEAAKAHPALQPGAEAVPAPRGA